MALVNLYRRCRNYRKIVSQNAHYNSSCGQSTRGTRSCRSRDCHNQWSRPNLLGPQLIEAIDKVTDWVFRSVLSFWLAGILSWCIILVLCDCDWWETSETHGQVFVSCPNAIVYNCSPNPISHNPIPDFHTIWVACLKSRLDWIDGISFLIFR
jgi:hypothetical protein